MDGPSQLNYPENLSYGEEDPISAPSPSPCEAGDARHQGAPPQETSVVRSLRRQSTEGSLETETAFNNRGLEDSYATDSSSVWSPEASYLFSSLFLPQCFVLCLVLLSTPPLSLKEKFRQKRKHCLEKQRPKEHLFK